MGILVDSLHPPRHPYSVVDKRPDGIQAYRGVPFDISAAGGK
ncbi:hypothetical protein [Yersinia intermedia]|nr:hypothetical protein [Yersinia intermedia]